ncbi:MAG: hypothetical protein ACLUVC_07330 [Longibaculum sp.]
MKKLLGIMLGVVMAMTSIVGVGAFEISIIDKVKMQVFNLVEENIDIKYSYPLYDVNGNYAYDLYEFAGKGYTVATHENGYISELMMEKSNPYEEVLNHDLYYLGPYNYFYRDEKNLKHVTNDIILSLPNQGEKTLNTLSNVEDNLSQIKELNNKMLSKEVNMISVYGDNVWHGNTRSFTRYSSSAWENNDNTCGPHAAAVMMAYLDDYVSDSIVASKYRTRNSSSPGSLITQLVKSTTNAKSTLPKDVYTGIVFTMVNNSTYSADYQTIGGTWNRAVREINRMGVVCIGLLAMWETGDGKKYGNHWVTAYQYKENSSNKGYFKCVDNWGASAAQIEATWTCGLVWIDTD